MTMPSNNEKPFEFNKSDLELAGCIRRLLKSRFILRSQNEKWFELILDRRKELQKIFDTMAARLEINESLRVAYLRPSTAEVEEALDYQLGRKKQLSSLASALIIYLRHQRLQYFLHPTSDPMPLIELMNLREYLEKFNTNTLDSQFERSFRKALSELVDLQILIETKNDSGIYEITPLCELLLSQDNISNIYDKMTEYFKSFSTHSEEGAPHA